MYYDGYVIKSSKHFPTDSYFYLSRYIAQCMMRFNICVGPVRTKMTNTQKMNHSEMSTQNIHNLNVWYSDESKSKRINADESK